jgi:sulfoxide reductase heme-binding subunit YedZ
LNYTKFIKPVVFLICLIPFAILVWDTFNLENLGANPVEALTHRTGDWALRFILIVLAVTPLRQLTGQVSLVKYRRMLGLFAFFYVCQHFLVYFLLDLEFTIEYVIEDILERPYITVGFTAFLLLIPLAVTSTKKMMRRLGSRWKKLHRTVYVIGILGVVHYIWLVKADLLEPLIYSSVLALLLGFRIWRAVGSDR